MNRFVIVDGLPYLLDCEGKTFSVKWDEKGFAVGAQVNLPYVPAVNHSELAVFAQCTNLDSITATSKTTETPKRGRKAK